MSQTEGLVYYKVLFYKLTFFHGKKYGLKRKPKTYITNMVCLVKQPCKCQQHKQCQEKSHLRFLKSLIGKI